MTDKEKTAEDLQEVILLEALRIKLYGDKELTEEEALRWDQILQELLG